jgi:hypothetical protein
MRTLDSYFHPVAQPGSTQQGGSAAPAPAPAPASQQTAGTGRLKQGGICVRPVPRGVTTARQVVQAASAQALVGGMGEERKIL